MLAVPWRGIWLCDRRSGQRRRLAFRAASQSRCPAAGLLVYATAATARSAALAWSPITIFRFGGDASLNKRDDLRTGGHILSKDLRDQARASPDPAIQELADLKGELPNTAARATDFGGGVAYVDGGLNVGVSVSRHTALYGVPIRYSLDPEVEAEAPRIDVAQNRIDARRIPCRCFVAGSLRAARALSPDELDRARSFNLFPRGAGGGSTSARPSVPGGAYDGPRASPAASSQGEGNSAYSANHSIAPCRASARPLLLEPNTYERSHLTAKEDGARHPVAEPRLQRLSLSAARPRHWARLEAD